jgi:autoinducer 2-degrading protein
MKTAAPAEQELNGINTSLKEMTMLTVHVFVHVKPDHTESFKTASIENAQHSRQEPGVAQFDVLQQQDDPARFLLVEVYRTKEDAARHKETDHYKKWRDTVADMMAEPRHSIKYEKLS